MSEESSTLGNSENQDLLRSSIDNLNAVSLARAYRWLHERSPIPFPKSIHLNLTLRCLGHCRHCWQWSWPKHEEFTRNELEHLFRIFGSWGIESVTFGGGNPLLHAEIGRALELASDEGIAVGIITEGVEMTDSLADAIGNHAKWIRFSLDGPTPDIHDSIRNSEGLFDTVVSNIRLLKDRYPHVPIGLNCVIQQSNWHVLDEIVDLGTHLGVDAVLFKLPHGDDPGGSYLLGRDQAEQVAEWVRSRIERTGMDVSTNLAHLHTLLTSVCNIDDVVDGRPVRRFYRDAGVHCFAPLFFMTCDSRGYVYPCDYLQADTRCWQPEYRDMRSDFCLGNVLEDSDQILVKLSELLRARVHGLPASGFVECGSCTRFCQLNADMTTLNRQLLGGPITETVINTCLQRTSDTDGGPSFL